MSGAVVKETGLMTSLRSLLATLRTQAPKLVVAIVVGLVLLCVREWKRLCAVFPAPAQTPTLSVRGIPSEFNKVPNVRCVHGQVGLGGKRVKKGVIYRSAKLSSVSASDSEQLDRMGLRLVIDFRTAQEVMIHPDQLPPGFTGRHEHVNVADGDLMKVFRDMLASNDGSARAAATMTSVMVGCATRHQAKFGQVLRWVAELKGPFLVHCTAGKDRTGWATAVVLRTLGVSKEDIMKDYLMSNDLWYKTARKYAFMIRFASWLQAPVEKFAPALQVRADYLNAAFSAVEEKWGTWDTYVQAPDGLGLSDEDLQGLRELMLE